METEARLSRAAVAKRLGVTVQMVWTLEKQGRLTVERIDGHPSYDAAEVEAFAQTYKPDPRAKRRKPQQRREEQIRAPLAARVMACLKRGLSLADTVLATEAHPSFVRRMFEEMNAPLETAAERRKREEDAAEAKRIQRQLDKDRSWDRRIELVKTRADAERRAGRR